MVGIWFTVKVTVRSANPAMLVARITFENTPKDPPDGVPVIVPVVGFKVIQPSNAPTAVNVGAGVPVADVVDVNADPVQMTTGEYGPMVGATAAATNEKVGVVSATPAMLVARIVTV